MFIHFRTRSKVDGYSLRSKTEAKRSDLPDAKSCMLFPHLTLDLQLGKQQKTENIESDVIVKFPEKSVLLQAKDGNDETQNESSLSSATSKSDSLQKVCKRIGDSSVIVSDEAAITWRGREEEKSEPTKELSPYYATTQEKQAFNKIKEWKEGFSLQLNQILQQRQSSLQVPAKNTKNKLDIRVSTSYCHDYLQEAIPYEKPTTSPLPARKSPPEKQALAHNMQHRIISELRALSQVSMKSKEGSQNSNEGKLILQEIKRQRGQVKCVHDDNDLKEEIESLEKQESQRIFHPWSKSDTNKDIDSFQKETALKRNREVGMKIDNKQDLPSTDALCTTHSQASESQVKEVLYSLRKTIDTIFTSTIQRISDLMVITGSSESYSEFNSQHCDQLLKKMEVAKEERDSLCLENINLKKEISDLKRQLAKTLDEGAGDISIGRVDSLKSTDSLVSQTAGVYVRIDEIHRVVSHFKEFAGGYRPNIKGALSADSYGTYASDSRPENSVACSKIDRCTKPPIKTQMTVTACSCNMLMKCAHFTQELEFSAF